MSSNDSTYLFLRSLYEGDFVSVNFLTELSKILKDKILISSDKKYWIIKGIKYEQCSYNQVLLYMIRKVQERFNDYIYSNVLQKQSVDLLKNKLGIWKKGSVDRELIFDKISSDLTVSNDYLIDNNLIKNEEIKNDDEGYFDISEDESSDIEISDEESEEEVTSKPISVCLGIDYEKKIYWMSNQIHKQNIYSGVGSKNYIEFSSIKGYKYNPKFNTKISSIVDNIVSKDVHKYNNYIFDIYRFILDKIVICNSELNLLSLEEIYSSFSEWFINQGYTNPYKCYKIEDKNHICSHKCEIISKTMLSNKLKFFLGNARKFCDVECYDIQVYYTNIIFKDDIKEKSKEGMVKINNKEDVVKINNKEDAAKQNNKEDVVKINNNIYEQDNRSKPSSSKPKDYGFGVPLQNQSNNDIKVDYRVPNYEDGMYFDGNSNSIYNASSKDKDVNITMEDQILIKKFINDKILVTQNNKDVLSFSKIYNKFLEWKLVLYKVNIDQKTFATVFKNVIATRRKGHSVFYTNVVFK
jgi:hypothetical protein